MEKQIKVILTGATGMVGEGVLLECLANNKVAEVLMVNRKHFNFQHAKLKELIIPDFLKAANFATQLIGYDACFWCAGKSSVGMNEEDYTKLTYTTTIEFAKVLKKENPDLVFNFVSGGHTDSTEQGKVMWARVKGKAENAILKLFPGKAFCYRPSLMKPTPGQKNLKGYNKLAPTILFPLLKLFFPNSTIADIGKAMINASTLGSTKTILEVAEINELAKK